MKTENRASSRIVDNEQEELLGRPSVADYALLEELNAEGATIVVITHDRGLADRMPRWVEMLDGRIVADTAHRPSSPPDETARRSPGSWR